MEYKADSVVTPQGKLDFESRYLCWPNIAANKPCDLKVIYL